MKPGMHLQHKSLKIILSVEKHVSCKDTAAIRALVNLLNISLHLTWRILVNMLVMVDLGSLCTLKKLKAVATARVAIK